MGAVVSTISNLIIEDFSRIEDSLKLHFNHISFLYSSGVVDECINLICYVVPFLEGRFQIPIKNNFLSLDTTRLHFKDTDLCSSCVGPTLLFKEFA